MEPPSPVARGHQATAPIIHPPHGSRKGGRLMPRAATRCHQRPRATTAWNATAPRLLEGLKARGARAMSHTLMPVGAGATISCSQRRTSHNIPQRATKRNQPIYHHPLNSAEVVVNRTLPRPAPPLARRVRPARRSTRDAVRDAAESHRLHGDPRHRRDLPETLLLDQIPPAQLVDRHRVRPPPHPAALPLVPFAIAHPSTQFVIDVFPRGRRAS